MCSGFSSNITWKNEYMHTSKENHLFIQFEKRRTENRTSSWQRAKNVHPELKQFETT